MKYEKTISKKKGRLTEFLPIYTLENIFQQNT